MRSRFLFVLCVTFFVVHAISAAPTGRWFDRVFIVLFENSDPKKVLADSHFAAFARKGTLLTNVSASARPSQPNYIALVAGSTLGVTTDGNVNLAGTSIVDKFESAGVTWKAYQEGKK
jgi:hypothetical protein